MSDCAFAVTARQALTRLGRDVVRVVAALAVQKKVDPIIYGRVVGHVRGTVHPYANPRSQNLRVVHGGIADHRATLADRNPGEVGAGDVVAGHDTSGGNPRPPSSASLAADVEYGIAPHDPRRGYPSRAGADGADDAQSLNDRAIALKIYSDTEA